MKLIINLLLATLPFAAVFSQSISYNRDKSTKVEWVFDSHNFGTVIQNNPVQFQFEFVNNCSRPVVITNIKSGCGCIKVAFSEQPVLPFLRGKITVTFLARTPGVFSKSVTVIFDNKEKITLHVMGEVIQESQMERKKK